MPAGPIDAAGRSGVPGTPFAPADRVPRRARSFAADDSHDPSDPYRQASTGRSGGSDSGVGPFVGFFVRRKP
jgi:hypothetical protein